MKQEKITHTLEKKQYNLEPFNTEENGYIHSQRPLKASQNIEQNYDLSHNKNV